MITSVKTSRTPEVQYLGTGLTHIAPFIVCAGAAVKAPQFPEIGLQVSRFARNIARPQRATRTMVAQLAMLNLGPGKRRR